MRDVAQVVITYRREESSSIGSRGQWRGKWLEEGLASGCRDKGPTYIAGLRHALKDRLGCQPHEKFRMAPRGGNYN